MKFQQTIRATLNSPHAARRMSRGCRKVTWPGTATSNDVFYTFQMLLLLLLLLLQVSRHTWRHVWRHTSSTNQRRRRRTIGGELTEEEQAARVRRLSTRPYCTVHAAATTYGYPAVRCLLLAGSHAAHRPGDVTARVAAEADARWTGVTGSLAPLRHRSTRIRSLADNFDWQALLPARARANGSSRLHT